MTETIKDKFNHLLKRHLLIVLIYIVLAIILTYPLLFLPAGALLGPPEDNMQYLWTAWQMKQALTTSGEGIFYTNYIFYPEGASLLLHSAHPLNNVFILFFNLFFSLEYSYNLTIFINFILNALSAYLLCLYFTKNRVASFVGGFIFSFSPFHLMRAMHHIAYVSSYLFPLIFLCFFSLRDRPSSKKGLLMGLLIIMIAFVNYYYFIFVLSSLLFGLFYFWISGKNQINRAFFKSVLLGIAISFLALAPLIISIMIELKSSHYPIVSGINRYVLDAFSFVTPLPLHPIWGRYTENVYRSFTGNPWEATGYLGMTVIFLAILGLAKWKKRKEDKAFFLWLMVITIVLSMGARLHILGYNSIPLPYWLIERIPILNMAIRAPGRWIVLTYLSLSVLASSGISYLYQKIKARTKYFIIALIIGLISFEYLAIPLHYTKFLIAPFYYEIQKARER